MYALAKITRLSRGTKKNKLQGKRLSRAQMRSQGYIDIIGYVKKSGDIDSLEVEPRGKTIPFEMANRILPTSVRRNIVVQLKGEFEQLTKRKKIFVVDEMLVLSLDAVERAYQKYGIDTQEIRNNIEEFRIADVPQDKYKGKKAKHLLLSQENMLMQELLDMANTRYDVEVPLKINDFFGRRASARGFESVPSMVQQNPWVLGELNEFRMSQLKNIAPLINPTSRAEVIIYANLTSNVWSYTRQGNSYAPLSFLSYRMRNVLIEHSVPRDKHNYYLSRLATPILKSLPHKNMSKLMMYSQYEDEAYEYYKEIYKEQVEVEPDKPNKVRMLAIAAKKGIYLIKSYYSEKDAANMITEYIEPHSLRYNKELLDSMSLDKWQKKAVINALTNRLSIINGPAGSGKTYTVGRLAKMLVDSNYKVIILAPSAMAANIAAKKTGIKDIEYATIHRVARILPEDEDYGEEDENRKPGNVAKDVVIVDEMSMCDIPTFSHLLHSMKENYHTHLVLVGDIAQLPAIGPSGFYHQLVRAGEEMLGIPTVNLKEQYRFKETHSITELANIVRQGKYPESLEGWQNIKQLELNMKTIKEIAKYLQSIGATGNDVMFLTSKKHERYGTNKLNQILRETFNPDGEKISNLPFYVGDPVISTKNFYTNTRMSGKLEKYRHPDRKRDIYNGTRGIITGYDSENKTITVLFETIGGKFEAPYTEEEMTYWLDVAYAITVHKAQGGEANHVVVVGEKGFTRNMLYTAITRAKESLYILGNNQYWGKVVNRLERDPLSKFIFRAKDNMRILEVEPEQEQDPDIEVLFG